MIYLLAALIAAFAYVVHFYRAGQRLSPDGKFYLALARGELVPLPYSRRPLLPFLLGASLLRWRVVSAVALIALGPLIAAYVPGTAAQKLTAVWLFVWLPGAFGLNVLFPVLVDAVAMAGALGAAILFASGHYVLGLLLVALLACVKESGPLFTAALSLSWLPLPIGVLNLIWRPASPQPHEEWLRHPARAARASRDVLDWRPLVSWGALLPLALLGAGHDRASLVALLSLGLAYGQLLVAQDNARLFQWAAPALLPLAVLPELGVWALPVLVGHVFVANSWRGT